jgi:hypothetical protein
MLLPELPPALPPELPPALPPPAPPPCANTHAVASIVPATAILVKIDFTFILSPRERTRPLQMSGSRFRKRNDAYGSTAFRQRSDESRVVRRPNSADDARTGSTNWRSS